MLVKLLRAWSICAVGTIDKVYCKKLLRSFLRSTFSRATWVALEELLQGALHVVTSRIYLES